MVGGWRRIATVVVPAFVSSTGPVWGQVHAHVPPDSALGTVVFPISCTAAAQVEFNRAVALLHHMTYPRAREAFVAIARTDPRCAMAPWGFAMTLFQPLWPTRPSPEDLRRGREAVERARALHPPTARERGFVEAAAAFFEHPTSTDYWRRLQAWEAEMARLYAAFPDDPEVTAFYALAHLAIAPSDERARAYADRAAALLLAVYRRNPDHPGAMHYLVHANDTQGRAHESLDITRKYETVAPENPHALHMPTHIYTRLGDWEAVIRGNVRAAAAARANPAGDSGQYVWDEFPHAIEYLVYAELQQGADSAADAEIRRLHGTAHLQPTFKTAFHLASTRARYALERRAWREAIALPLREGDALDWDRYWWPEAVTWYARGLGAAHLGDLAAARAAADRLDTLEAGAAAAAESLFTRNIRVLRLSVRAWIAAGEGDTAQGVSLMTAAAELERATPKHAVTPAPTLPADELLGDLLLEQGNPAAALTAYRRALDSYPRRFNALLGAARAARAAGDTAQAREGYRALLEVAGASPRAAIAEARAFLADRP